MVHDKRGLSHLFAKCNLIGSLTRLHSQLHTDITGINSATEMTEIFPRDRKQRKITRK